MVLAAEVVEVLSSKIFSSKGIIPAGRELFVPEIHSFILLWGIFLLPIWSKAKALWKPHGLGSKRYEYIPLPYYSLLQRERTTKSLTRIKRWKARMSSDGVVCREPWKVLKLLRVFLSQNPLLVNWYDCSSSDFHKCSVETYDIAFRV